MVSLLWDQFWWPGMSNEGQNAVKNCLRCIRHEGQEERAKMLSILATGPLDILHLDFTKIEVSGDADLKKQPKTVNVLVMTDHFMRHTMAFVTKEQTTNTVAHYLYHNYRYIFGAPTRIITDRSKSFTSEIVI